MKAIKISSCKACPHLDHGGGFGSIAYIPICGLANRSQRYTKSISGSRIVADIVDEIPTWCPLEDYPNAD